MTTMASQITRLTVVYSIIYSGADQRKHQSSGNAENVSIWWRHEIQWKAGYITPVRSVLLNEICGI